MTASGSTPRSRKRFDPRKAARGGEAGSNGLQGNPALIIHVFMPVFGPPSGLGLLKGLEHGKEGPDTLPVLTC
jgi:hypothetical protein